MFKHIVIKNFRGFASLQLSDLARINLIAGKNNTGKTAVLEAIYHHTHPADIQSLIAINQARGIAEPGTAVEDIVAWTFHRRYGAGGLEVTSWDEKGVSRTLSTWLLDAASSRQQFSEAETQLSEGFRQSFADANLPRIVLRYEQPGEPTRYTIGVFMGSGFSSSSAKIPWKIDSVYLSSGVPSAEQDMKHFGELEAAKRQDEILPALRILEPRLQRLALVPLSGKSVIHGDIGLPRLVPVPFMGEGVRRVLSMVMAIANAPGGIVLIDEVENGLHYSVQKKVWQAVGLASRQADVQILATTHSEECIQAAQEAFSEDGLHELKYYRLDRDGEKIEAKSLNQDLLERVQDTDLEIR